MFQDQNNIFNLCI